MAASTKIKILVCEKCGEDCSKYGHEEFLGRPYHAGCLPPKENRRELARQWVEQQKPLNTD